MSETRLETANVLVILAEFVVPEAAMPAFMAAAADDAHGSVSSEPGCRQFDMLVSRDNSTQVTLLEIYDDSEAFEAHLHTPHYARFKEAVDRLDLAAPTVRRMSRMLRGGAA